MQLKFTYQLTGAGCQRSAAAPSQIKPQTRPRLQRRLVVQSSVAFEPEVIPPPPPPPPSPPPPAQQTSRRAILQSVAVGGAGLVAGFLLGRQQQAVPGVDPQERKEIDDLRGEAKFRRDYDGHVFVQARDDSWFEVRLDAQIPGTVLLRDKDDFIYFITLNIQQIDLTDDYVVISIFGDGSWETTLQKVQGKDDVGQLVDARMDQEAFRDLVSIME